ncbi:MAG TPA: GAF domain-containing sensor histidine kinase [Solirubrobacteraceae bacterium]|nr:GAF domain-containing sensor histidine kinase [Solirubrobacteraceae bacterium]
MDRAAQRILEVARSVLSELDLDAVLDRVLDAAQELTEARYAALGVLDESTSELSRFITRGIDGDTHTAIGTLPRGRGVLGVLIEEPAPLRLSDVDEHPRSYGFPPEHPPMKSFLGVPILIDGEPYGNLYLTEKAGGAGFSEADEQAVVTLAEYAAVAIDHARRYAGASERRDELERTVATLQATTEIARALGGETDPEIVLRLVAKRGRALVAARAVLIELIHGEQLEIAAGAGELPAGVIRQRVALANTVAAHAMRTRRVQRLEDELNRARFDEHGLGQLGVNAKAGIVIPLIFRGTVHGVLLVLDRLRDGPRFSAEDERLLEAFATSAASAVATAQSVTSERHRQRLAAAEGERSRWARELHDETLQGLNALRLGLAAAGRSEQSSTARTVFAQSVEQLEDTIANLRALITDLRPAALDALGVRAAIETLADRNAREDLEIDMSVELGHEQGQESTRMSGELETALYRITQEALTNATKHGQATRVVVEIHEDPTTVHLTVRDNGRGFDPDAQSDGFGLLGIHERTELLGGELQIESTPGKGTTLSARLPVQRRTEQSTRARPGQLVAPPERRQAQHG